MGSIVLLCEAEDKGRLCKGEDKGRWPDPKIFLCIRASAADAAAISPKENKAFLTNGLITFFINGNPFFYSKRRSLPRNPPDSFILDALFFL